MAALRSIVVVVLVLAGVLLYLSTYVVGESEVALKMQFGEIVEAGIGPGVHLKLPVVQTVRKFDGRVRGLSAEGARFETSDGKIVVVDVGLKWRIGDLGRFYTAAQADPAQVGQRLSEILQAQLRPEFAARTVEQTVAADRAELLRAASGQLETAAKELGVELVDLRIQRLELPSELTQAVFERMKSAQALRAQEYRARGKQEAAAARAEADRISAVIVAEARRDADRIRGEADAQAARIYAEAAARDPEFFNFYRSLMAYRRVFDSPDDVLVLSPDSAFFRYFQQSRAGAANGR